MGSSSPGSRPADAPRTLLVPMDDSEPARAALEHALTLFPDDEIVVVHAVDELETMYGGSEADRDREPAFFEDLERLAADHGVDVETAVVKGRPPEAILECIEERGVDQVIMGSEGRSGVSRMVLGSVAETVTRRASVPVTIVR